MSDGGESGDTFHAVHAFCTKNRPAIVLLENVLHAPWDDMLKLFEDSDYLCAGVTVDSKDFYIPQTRCRGYMVCFDQSRLAKADKAASEKWTDLMAKFKRPASSSVLAFLQTNASSTSDQQPRMEEATREIAWAKCEITQMEYRRKSRLGLARPLTNWQESGAMLIPENGSQSWYRGLSERMLDTLDILLLRKALPSKGRYDVRHKTRIIDITQNVYMQEDSNAMGIVGCITPTAQFFISDAGRAMLPEETLMLQGLPLDKISFTTEAPSDLRNLAGNAMTTTVVGSAILSALTAGYKFLGQPDGRMTNGLQPMSRNAAQTALLLGAHTVQESDSNEQIVDMPMLLRRATLALRRCFCEGAQGIAKQPIQQCADCEHTTCVACGGNPAHNYRQLAESGSTRISVESFETELRSCLPLRIQLGTVNGLRKLARSTKGDIMKYLEHVEQSVEEPFHISHFRRTHCLTLMYQSRTARLELVFIGGRAEWRLFVLPPAQLASNDPFRQALTQPVAVAPIGAALFGNPWQWRLPTTTDIRISITGSGSKAPSWLQRIGLPDFRDDWQWEMLTISILDKKDIPSAARSIEGTYQFRPHCGTANESLYAKQDKRGQPLYLFLDPTRTGHEDLDQFVFATNKDSLEYDEVRPVIGRVVGWRSWGHVKPRVEAVLQIDDWSSDVPNDGHMTVLPSSLQTVRLKGLKTPSIDGCQRATTIVGGLVPHEVSKIDLDISDLSVAPVLPNDCQFYSENSWIFEELRRSFPMGEWLSFAHPDATQRCSACAPISPPLKWKLGEKNEIVPYPDSQSATMFERAIKQRPNPLMVEKSLTQDGERILLGANLLSLAHRAFARLPETEDIRFSWRIVRGSGESSRFRPFRLSKTTGLRPFSQDLQCAVTLFPTQQLSLAWMKQQDSRPVKCEVEEIEEAILPGLGWTAEMRATGQVEVRGGICADFPGSGKTIKTLALIQSELLERNAADIIESLESQPIPAARGLLPSAATLVLVPRSLMEQWRSEIEEKMGWDEGVLSISTTADLDMVTLQEMQEAKCILVSQNVTSSDSYVERLANFAGIPGPATTTRPRPLAEWRKAARKDIPEHLEVLQGSGLSVLQKLVKRKYEDNLNDEVFKASVPSRRLRGREYVSAADRKNDASVKSSKAAPKASGSINVSKINSPLFEMFYWNRLVVDEFHQMDAKDHNCIVSLVADKRWGLSATPAMDDCYDISRMASILGLHLRTGSDARGLMKQKNAAAMRADMTPSERFVSMQQMPSARVHQRIRQSAQQFLDTFVRRDIEKFADLEYSEHLVPVTLDIAHRALYAELSQHLNSLDMRIRKSNKKKAQTTDRDTRLHDAIATSESAEEALSTLAASSTEALSLLIRRREKEIGQCKIDLEEAAVEAKAMEAEVLADWALVRLEKGMLGDEETIADVKHVLEAVGQQAKAKRASKTSDQDASNDDGARKEKGARDRTSDFNKIATRLLVCNRSLRFLKNVEAIQQQVAKKAARVTCDRSDCRGQKGASIGVSAFCGHTVCSSCFGDATRRGTTKCPAQGCTADIRDFHLLWDHKMGNSLASATAPSGAKIEAATTLLRDIRTKQDQAILFVQYEAQLDEVEQALQEASINAIVVKESKLAGQQIESFRQSGDDDASKPTVLVLNASSETAAGFNLQNANHVIFLSPLLRDTQYEYEATMAQAIGRVRRPGQKKPIHVYRIAALDTIDVDILEHRERRMDALKEQSGPKISPPTSTRVSLRIGEEAVGERTQLVREKDRFSSRPRSWLVAKEDGSEQAARVSGKGRVAGWEDFSSLIKWSRAYTENDL